MKHKQEEIFLGKDPTMAITREIINNTFCEVISLPNGNVLSKEGFVVLADWSEQQEWWHEFAKLNNMEHDWRSTPMGDPYQFALTLFRFIRQ
ncbi:MAG: hypothetical protein WA003_03575 [Desulfuromonadaceae bacterium]